ncbi:hypothetical protein [Pseudomonas viridiflava]|uniref:hypothetical protein n=1 Tax=Pseudomonas viridiflava TaxID=33069 RepID=UPI002E9DC4E6|nr:hypothetical protein [Pseudomonas viridiflava]
MKRDLKHVKHLLDLVQAYAGPSGIDLEELEEKWCASGGKPETPLAEREMRYLVRLCTGAGFLTSNSGSVQLTWSGHDYLDSVTHRPFPS